MSKTPQQWRAELGLDDLEKKNFLDRGFLTAVLAQESGGRQNAVSSAGAGGLFQLMPKTAEGYGVDRFDPQESANGAAAMYADLRKKYDGDLNKMLAGYNWGQGNVDKAIAAAEKERNETGRPVDWQSKLPAETKEYIKKIRGTMAAQSSAEGRYEEAANYASGTDSPALNAYSEKNRVKARNGKTRNPLGDKEDDDDNYSLLREMIQEDPLQGILLMFFMSMTGMIDSSDINNLLGDIDKLPPEKRQAALDSLSEGDREKYYSANRLKEFSKDLTGGNFGEKAAELAERFLGQKEEKNNCGDIVALSGVEQGQPWCGGFANYILGSTMPGVYKGENFNLAINYKNYGEKFGAFHKNGDGYQPEKGDVILFSREGGSGHVGIVTGRDAAGHITYIAGNDGNKVSEHSLKDDGKLLGFTSSREIANAKGITFDVAVANAPKLEAGVELANFSKFPENVRNAVAGLDLNHDGLIASQEVAKASGQTVAEVQAALKNQGVVPADTGTENLYTAIAAVAKKSSAAEMSRS